MKNNKKDIESLIKKILLEEMSLLKEGEWEEKNKPETASTWEKLKYVMGRLGSYKVNGKFFGKKKELAAAEAKIEAIVKKESNKFLLDLKNLINEKNPEFPNNLKGADFLSSVMSIAACYDSIVEATKKENLPIDAANGIINDLRKYVKFILDAKLSASYSTVDESIEEDYKELDEAFGITEDAESDLRDKLKADRISRAGKKGGKDFRSTKVDTLKSFKLPLTLLGVGSALGGLSWLINTDWFKSLFEIITPDSYTDAVETSTEVVTDIKPGEGVYKLLGRVTDYPLDGNSSPSEFIDALEEVGGGNASKGVDMLCANNGVMMNPEEAKAGLKEFLKNPNDYKNMNDLFHGSASGTGKLVPTDTTLYGTISGKQFTSMLLKIIPGVFIKGSARTGAAYGVAKGLGAILGPIGVGLMSAGAVVLLMRRKGLKTSRAATLNALLQSLRNIPKGTAVEPEGEIDDKVKIPTSDLNPGPLPTGDAGANTDKQKKKGDSSVEGSSDDLYNTLKNLFKTIVNNRKKLGTRTSDNVGRDRPVTGTAEKNKKGSSDEKEPSVEDKTTIKVGGTYDIAAKGGKKSKEVEIVDINTNKKGDSIATVKRTDGTALAKNRIAIERLEAMVQFAKDIRSNAAVNENYITNTYMIDNLKKQMSYDRVESFEELLKLVENLRNKIRNAKQTEDARFNNLIDVFSDNPIMSTDFKTMFDVSPDKDSVNSIKALIDDVFLSLYSSKFGRDNLIDKMASTGGGNINALQEKKKKDDNNKSFVKDAKSRDRFKGNLIKFLRDAIRLFQHMYSRRKQK